MVFVYPSGGSGRESLRLSGRRAYLWRQRRGHPAASAALGAAARAPRASRARASRAAHGAARAARTARTARAARAARAVPAAGTHAYQVRLWYYFIAKHSNHLTDLTVKLFYAKTQFFKILFFV